MMHVDPATLSPDQRAANGTAFLDGKNLDGWRQRVADAKGFQIANRLNCAVKIATGAPNYDIGCYLLGLNPEGDEVKRLGFYPVAPLENAARRITEAFSLTDAFKRILAS